MRNRDRLVAGGRSRRHGATAAPTRWAAAALWAVLALLGGDPAAAGAHAHAMAPPAMAPQKAAKGGGATPGSAQPGAAIGGRTSDAAPVRATSRFPLGEKLVYRGKLRKAGITVNAGRATFTVTRNERGEPVFSACARGEKFGYVLATAVRAVWKADESTPFVYDYCQGGSEHRKKRLRFGDQKAQYIREKHCREPGCQDPAHLVRRPRYVGGFIPWGKRWVHCPDRKCRKPEHRHWKVRHDHDLDRPHYDMLSAVYYARSLGLSPGQSIEVPVINDHDRWTVVASAARGETIRVPAGSFDTVRLILDPKAEKGSKPSGRFEGLFGLNGAIHIWLDRATGRPVKVRGKLPFGFLDLDATVELVSIGTAEEPCTLSEVGMPAPREEVTDR